MLIFCLKKKESSYNGQHSVDDTVKGLGHFGESSKIREMHVLHMQTGHQQCGWIIWAQAIGIETGMATNNNTHSWESFITSLFNGGVGMAFHVARFESI